MPLRPPTIHPSVQTRLTVTTPPPPTTKWGKASAAAMAAAHRVWQPTAYALNCEWLNLRRWPSLALLTLLLVGLGLTVGFTAMPVKDGVTLGVEFGGGYNIL